MSIKPVLVPDHTANDLRRLMDHFAEASTGPTKRQLNESRAAVAAAQGVTEAAKWRTHPDAHDHDTDGSPVPKGGIKSDPLATRQGVSRTQSEKDPKSLSGKFGDKYAKKHGVPTKQLMKNIPLDDIDEQGVSEGPEKEYHVINHKGTPTVVSPNGKMNKNFSSTYDAQQFAKKKNAEIDKKKRVSENLNEFLAPDGSNYGGGGGGDEPRQFRVIITLYDDSSAEDETAERKIGITVTATSEKAACDLATTMLLKSPRYDGSRITNVTARPVLDEQTMSRAAKGYEKYGRAGMAALAKAGREGRALDPVRDRYDRYDEAVAEGSAGAELKAIDGDYYEDSTDFFSMFDQDHFDREEESEDGMEIRGYIDDVCVMVFKFSTPDRMGGWGNYDDSALVAEGHDHGPDHTHSHDHEEEHDEVCPECDGAGCPECYGEEDRDRAYDRARGMERESVGMMEEDSAVKYGVFAKGGSVGSQRFRDDPLKTFDTREEATADARRRRSGLSKGERGYYRMGYVVKPIKGEVDEGMIDNIKNTVRAANYDRLARRSNSQAVAGGGFAPPAQFKSLSAKGDQRAQKAQDIRKGSAEQVDEIDMGLVGDAMAGAAAGLGSVGLGSYIGHKIGNKIGQKFIDRSNRKKAEAGRKPAEAGSEKMKAIEKARADRIAANKAYRDHENLHGYELAQDHPEYQNRVNLGNKKFRNMDVPSAFDEEQQVDEKSEAIRHGNNSRSIYHVDEGVDPIEQLRADIKRFAQ
jgi:hypothetical protein